MRTVEEALDGARRRVVEALALGDAWCSDPFLGRHPRWLVVDHSPRPCAGDVSTALRPDDDLAAAVASGRLPPVLRLWRHAGALVLGRRDTRLPLWREAAADLGRRGWAVGVRPSGGLAVPLDAGVLCLSWIHPDAGCSVAQQYRALHALLRAAVSRCTGRRPTMGEVPGAFCPGSNDLALEGRKVGGMALHRRRRAVVVHAFLLVRGEGAARMALVEAFYRRAGGLGPA
ncbi:MAG: hypothetical protein IRY95_05605, partial [Clostridia bacterium]|nr:hypothetical protein [Clostridia bacterium]